MNPTRSAAGYLISKGPTVLVLALFIALGVWGVRTDWAAPKFSELWGPPEEKPPENVIVISPEPEGPDNLARLFDKRRLTFPSPQSVQRAGIQVVKVEPRDLSVYITANGVIDYNQNRIAHLSTRVPGNVYRVLKHVGEAVHKGDVLALVESADVGTAKAEFRQNLVMVDIKKKIFDRMQPAIVPERQIQVAEAELRVARSKLYNSQQTLLNLGLPVSLESLANLPESKLDERLRRLGVEDLGALSFLTNEASSNLIPLRAPFNGTVVGRDMVEGEIVRPQMVQFTVADLSTMWIILDVKQEDTAALALAQEVRFTSDSIPDLKVKGNVDWISSDVDEKTRTVRVRVMVANQDSRLRAHTFGTGRIYTRSVKGALAVPESAVLEVIQQGPGDAATESPRKPDAVEQGAIVFVRLSETEFEARMLRCGIHDAGYVQVLNNLRIDAEVVTTGNHALKQEILKTRVPEGD